MKNKKKYNISAFIFSNFFEKIISIKIIPLIINNNNILVALLEFLLSENGCG